MRAGAKREAAFHTAVLRQAAARMLSYPEEDLHRQLPLLREAVTDAGTPAARFLLAFLDHAEATPLDELATHYVRTFDFEKRHCLHLTWWEDGDTRRRGAALLRVKQTYQRNGMELIGGELPDFLPVVLEFSAVSRTDELLRRYRAGLEQLRTALAQAGTPYAHVVAGICATLPALGAADRTRAERAAAAGPPREDVGLTPYGTSGPVLVPLTERAR
ncbi:nitrate reductase molybdenum cofactor assembly chaperone [Streptomyces reniochalinae]|nr:nitrate reductase molybdenum cofactor assembly chaperone [Streptomyces reniochalinae]